MTRVFCCGNRDRGDDAAALLVAECLQRSGIDVEIYEGDPLAIMDRWDPSDDVIVVDAMVTGAPAGSVRVWEPPQLGDFAGAGASTHGLGVAEAIRLAEMLGRLPRRLRVYGIEGKQFEPGGPVTPEVQEAVGRVAQEIAGKVVLAARLSNPRRILSLQSAGGAPAPHLRLHSKCAQDAHHRAPVRESGLKKVQAYEGREKVPVGVDPMSQDQ